MIPTYNRRIEWQNYLFLMLRMILTYNRRIEWWIYLFCFNAQNDSYIEEQSDGISIFLYYSFSSS